MASLLELPTEIYDAIFSHLVNPQPPSKLELLEVPSDSMFFSSSQTLKTLAPTCRFMHRLTSPMLFNHLRANVGNIHDFVGFVRKYDLKGKVESLVLFSTASTDIPSGVVYPAVLTAMMALDPPELTLVLSPNAMGEVLPYELVLEEEWAFDIKLQVLRLKRNCASQTSPTASISPEWKILSLRPWYHITLNEGSSVAGYGTYHYHSKRTLTHALPLIPTDYDVNYWLHNIKPTANLLTQLTSFDLIAVFPLRLSFATTWIWLRYMPHLKRLRTQLAPTKDNHALKNPALFASVTSQDVWRELQHTYSYLGYVINQHLFRHIDELIILDYGVNERTDYIVDSALEPFMKAWQHDGEGAWTRERFVGRSAGETLSDHIGCECPLESD